MVKPVAFFVCLGPFFWLVWAGLTGHLSANPLSDLTNETGAWALRFLCITLAITPFRRLSGWNGAIRFRRMSGLFAFFYGTLHFLAYVIVDRFAGLDFPNGIVAWTTVENLVKAAWDDVYKRPFITVGFATLASMVPLAVTSTAGMIRRLGGRRWSQIHRITYLTAVLGVVHYWWLVKADIRRPLAYGAVVACLLVFRLYWARLRGGAPARAAVHGAHAA
jgi:sulfoxide reductase heme-binding subunit YedZ